MWLIAFQGGGCSCWEAGDQLELQHFPEMVRLLKNVNSTATDSEASIVIKEHLKF